MNKILCGREAGGGGGGGVGVLQKSHFGLQMFFCKHSTGLGVEA